MSERGIDLTVRRSKEIFSIKTGERIDMSPRLFAEFQKGGIPEWAMPLAVERFRMNGKPPELTPQQWLYTYDSKVDQFQRGWTDEERELIEAKLRSKPKIVEISKQPAVKPWPKYDTLVTHGRRTIEKVVELVVTGIDTTGVDASVVLEYERENLNRAEVIAAVEALAVPVEEETEPLIAA
jgi:hypothetical protein